MNQHDHSEVDVYSRPLNPKERARSGCKGRPVNLGKHGDWLFPYHVYAPTFDAIRGRLHDSILTTGTVGLADIMVPAYSLMLANYYVSVEELKILLWPPTKWDVLAEAVLACLLGEEDPTHSYSDWVRSSLLANGHDPEETPEEFLPVVLKDLEDSGRIVPIQRFPHLTMRKPVTAAFLSN